MKLGDRGELDLGGGEYRSEMFGFLLHGDGVCGFAYMG